MPTKKEIVKFWRDKAADDRITANKLYLWLGKKFTPTKK